MWIPESAEELQRAITEKALPHESASYEYKRELPLQGRNRDIAIDVAAMSVGGGIIIYGVDEDKKAVTFSATPITLAGTKDRISDVVTSQLREPPYFRVNLLSLPSDAKRGFVVIDIPASPRAPHMVEVKGEHRYYGRVPGGNSILSESQVGALYERRERTEREARAALDTAIALAPLAPTADRGDLHVVVHPLVPNEGMRERLLPDHDQVLLHRAVQRTRQAIPFIDRWNPNFGDILNGNSARREKTLEGTALLNPSFPGQGGEIVDRWVSRLEVTEPGTIRYFHAAVVLPAPDGLAIIRDTAVAQMVADVTWFAGQAYADDDYHGAVDVAVAVTGVEGAVSAVWLSGTLLPPIGQFPQFPAPQFTGRVRVSAEQLLSDPCGTSKRLLIPLLRVVRGDGFPDPLRLAPA